MSVRKRAFGLALTGLFIGWLGWYVSNNYEAFERLADVSLLNFIGLFGAFMLVQVCNAFYLREILSAFSVQASMPESMSLTLFSSFANLFMPMRGGAGLRALYLNRVHRISVADFVASLSAMYVMYLVLNGGLAAFGMMVVWHQTGHWHAALFFAFLSSAIVGLGLALWRPPGEVRQKTFPWKQLGQVAAGWAALRSSSVAHRNLWLASLGVTVATIWQTDQAFSSFREPLALGSILVYAGAKNIAFLAALTPGSIGFVEGMAMYLGSSLGFTASEALMAQGLVRGVSLVSLGILGPLAMYFLRARLGSNTGRSGQED